MQVRRSRVRIPVPAKDFLIKTFEPRQTDFGKIYGTFYAKHSVKGGQ